MAIGQTKGENMKTKTFFKGALFAALFSLSAVANGAQTHWLGDEIICKDNHVAILTNNLQNLEDSVMDYEYYAGGGICGPFRTIPNANYSDVVSDKNTYIRVVELNEKGEPVELYKVENIVGFDDGFGNTTFAAFSKNWQPIFALDFDHETVAKASTGHAFKLDQCPYWAIKYDL